VIVPIACGLARRVFHEYMLYRQLRQFLSLCLINGLPLAPLCGERRSAHAASAATIRAGGETVRGKTGREQTAAAMHRSRTASLISRKNEG